MNALKEILKSKLNQLKIPYEDSNILSVKPKDSDGFTVWMDDTNGITVGYDGWHESFANENEAMNCFLTGLTSKVRLKVIYHGKTATKWCLEQKMGDEWKMDSETGLLIVPFWKGKMDQYLQNNFINI